MVHKRLECKLLSFLQVNEKICWTSEFADINYGWLSSLDNSSPSNDNFILERENYDAFESIRQRKSYSVDRESNLSDLCIRANVIHFHSNDTR